MFLQRKNNLVYAEFSNLASFPHIFHAVFTGPDSGAEANSSGGESERSGIRPSLKHIKEYTKASGLIFLNQVHGAEVCVINTQHEAESAAKNPPAADAVISGVPGKGLVIQAADCQAVMLYDPVHDVAANVHSGWRGSVSNIIGKCIGAMRKNFYTDPSDLVAGIGPSLGPCCAEFFNYKKEIPEPFWIYKDARDRFDFWQASVDQLRATGVKKENIELSNICTMCNTHLFFSYRAGAGSKRFAAVIGIKGD
ncbi:MAG: polyphenol oxidase family protein [Desulfosalsimonas sp.]